MFACFASAVLAGVAGCSRPAVDWGDVTYPAARPALDSARPDAIPALAEVAGARGCRQSVSTSELGGVRFFAWWSVRADSSSLLTVGRWSGQGEWDRVVIADSADRSARGCARPAPAITGDEKSGYLHVAYYLEPATGSGIHFAHSMDDGRSFHEPVAIVYGNTPAAVSVAAGGDRVIVAYEDPNARRPAVGVALSETMGHIFEARMEASPQSARAAVPEVELSGDSVTLWWRETPLRGAAATERNARRAGLWTGGRR